VIKNVNRDSGQCKNNTRYRWDSCT